MKIITLNVWGGRVHEELFKFIEKYSKDTDVFCFQEVFNGGKRLESKQGVITDMFTTMEKLLPDFNGFHAESGKFGVDFGGEESYGIAMFVKKKIEIKSQGVYEIFQLDEKLDLPEGILVWNRLLQYVTIPYKSTALSIFNLHGLYTGGGKDDVDARIKQSEKARAFMNKIPGEKVLCGDFNLNPETQSFAILADGMRDLIKENNITSTRSHYYTKPLKFADYMLVTPGMEIKRFEVLQDVVSDHLPLVLEIDQ